MTKPTPRQVYRVCAICGKRHGMTYGFRNILARNGIKGDKATIACVRAIAKRQSNGKV